MGGPRGEGGSCFRAGFRVPAAGTPGGSSCSQPDLEQLWAEAAELETWKTGSQIRKSLSPWVRRECLRKHSPSRRFVFLLGEGSSLPSWLPLYPLHPSNIPYLKRPGKMGRREEVPDLPPSLNLSSKPSKGSSERGAAISCGDFHPFAVRRFQVWDGIGGCDLREDAKCKGRTLQSLRERRAKAL